PSTSDQGRSYTFRLRPGLRYSDGRPIRASDFARSMQRIFRVGSPGAGFFATIVGADSCVRRPPNCRLPHGVIADDSARTVSFLLSEPDPDFLLKLALGFVVPIP